jgi:hypothetical protein
VQQLAVKIQINSDKYRYSISSALGVREVQIDCMRKRKKKKLEEMYERSQILPKLEKLFATFSCNASKVKKNFNQIRYLIELMNDFCCYKAYL